MKLFLDTEFTEQPHTIELISIGIVSERGDTFYAESTDFNPADCNPWVQENVLPKLHLSKNRHLLVEKNLASDGYNAEYRGSRTVISSVLLDWLGTIGARRDPEFWGYYGAYDWVVFCWLFGPMVQLPDGFPMFLRDIRQIMDSMSAQCLASKPDKPDNAHDALADAFYHRELYKWATNCADVEEEKHQVDEWMETP